MADFPTNPVFCKDCKHLIGVRHYTEGVDSKWKCGHPENRFANPPSLVTGEIRYGYRIEMIGALRYREDLCGYDGTWYEKYEPPVLTYNPTASVETKPSATPTLDKLKRLKVNINDL